ncbi:MAG: FtsW/RodA/SpoVE family cell cycle protein [Proteobacteria bacterium]|nr:FtsW/RodA/SpoVE family cell cycle protein [Pseudomonadota bacterium]
MIARTRLTKKSHPLMQWWKSIDKITFFSFVLVSLLGLIILSSASAGMAPRLNVHSMYFVRKQALFMIPGTLLICGISFLHPKHLKTIALGLLAVAIVGIVVTIFSTSGVKGAKRWLFFGGFSIQPSELLKPSLAIIFAGLLANKEQTRKMQGFYISFLIIVVVGVLMFLQPDMGMFLIIGAMWACQIWTAGVNMKWIFLLGFGLFGIVIGAYVTLPHFSSRIDRFLGWGDAIDTYQVDKAQEAFLNGGFLGKGFANGSLKYQLPDAHTDFIFAVIGEELGAIFCLIILVIYSLIIYSSFAKLYKKQDRFSLIAGSGLISIFALQVIINMSVALNLLPTTGMTLPFISYGGSSLVSLSLVLGGVLCLTKKDKKL